MITDRQEGDELDVRESSLASLVMLSIDVEYDTFVSLVVLSYPPVVLDFYNIFLLG